MDDENVAPDSRLSFDDDCENCLRHYVDGIVYSANDGQHGTHAVLGVALFEGCLGIGGETDPNHVWVSCTKMVYAIYRDNQAGHISYRAVAWIDTPVQNTLLCDDMPPIPSNRPNPDPAHCVNAEDFWPQHQQESGGDPKYTKRKALLRYMREVVLEDANLGHIQVDPNAEAFRYATIKYSHPNTFTVDGDGGAVWNIPWRFDIKRSGGLNPIAGMRPHPHGRANFPNVRPNLREKGESNSD
jgi:hypothetical protein